MSPTPHRLPISTAAAKALARMGVTAGLAIRDERLRRQWTLRDLADRAGVSPAQLQQLEAGAPVSLETYARVTTSLDLWPELTALDPRRRQPGPVREQDFVHAAMGELEVSRLRSHGFGVAIDEPYQHDQFAGRADVVAWDVERRALLHLENRTRFPDIQDALGSYAAKRRYLADVLGDRFGIHGRWRSVTHVIVALWSAEVLHSLRLRTETFLAACPGPAEDFLSWWAGKPIVAGGSTSSLVLLDPSPAVDDARRVATLDDLARDPAALSWLCRRCGATEGCSRLTHFATLRRDADGDVPRWQGGNGASGRAPATPGAGVRPRAATPARRAGGGDNRRKRKRPKGPDH